MLLNGREPDYSCIISDIARRGWGLLTSSGLRVYDSFAICTSFLFKTKSNQLIRIGLR